MSAFDVLVDPVRRRILELLADGERPAMAVTEVIRAEFGISQPAVSQHLRVLREAGFAGVRADGARRLYSVQPDALQEVDEWLDRQVSAVRREVGSRVLEAGEARVVTLSQVYDTDVDDLWDAVTNPERLPRWFAPVSGDLRLGGRYQIEGNAEGTVERCEPPTTFSATWEFGGDVSWIEVRLVPEGGGTRLVVEHIAHVADERWGEFGPGAVGVGWDLVFLGMALHAAHGDAFDKAEAEAWTTSDDGKRFMARCSELWGEADAADGVDAALAKERADRVAGFYTG